MAMEQQALSQILETAVVAARLAGQRAMEEMNYVKATFKTETELVTDADRRCQQIIVDRIRENFPDHGFIGEEGEPGKIFKRAPRGEPSIWWVIDPIDGTNNFAHGIPIFTVSTGVLYEGRPIAGVVFDRRPTRYTPPCKAGSSAQRPTHRGRRRRHRTDAQCRPRQPVQRPAPPLGRSDRASVAVSQFWNDRPATGLCRGRRPCGHRGAPRQWTWPPAS